jgi:undecaprenyl phosphate N,N'-diacetylbacillosamine 1-phosphate transferase
MDRIQQTTKRGLDIFLTLLFSPLLLSISLVIGIVIRFTAGSNVIFRQQRAGENSKPFTLYKFRTMRLDADPFGPSPKNDMDSRLFPVGRWLRKTSLDELPQFWNVMKGDMSLVGPRPLYMEQAEKWNENQRRRLLVKPGLTGLAQIHGRAAVTIEEKIELDLKYVDNFSIYNDLKILFTTLTYVIFSRDIYEKKYSKTEATRGDSNAKSS